MTFEYVSRVPPEGGAEQEMLCVSGASFRLTPVADPDDSDTMFAVWVQATASANIEIIGGSSDVVKGVGTSWQRIETLLTGATNIVITVPNGSTAYFYKAKFEIGTRSTDWTPAPEDADEAISNAQDDANAAMDAASSAQESADSASRSIAETQRVIKIETDGLYIYPGIRTQSGDVEIDTSGYHQRFTNMSQRIQRADSLRPDFATSPTVLVLGNQAMFRSADGGTGWRLATADDFAALGV